MIFIYLIIFIISINGILTRNLSNHFIIIASCQINKTESESIPIRSDRRYYFYFSTQSLSSLSSSSSFLPLLHLSYCEHQQTTSYSSSGFSILYSSPHFPLTDIQDKKHSSSFHHHNAALSAIDQSPTPSRNFTTIMSSSNQNPVIIDNNDNLITTAFSNISLLNTSLPSVTTTIEKENHRYNMMLLVGCIISTIIIMIIIYLIIKCCNRDEGTYKIDESNNYSTKSHLNISGKNGCTGIISLSSHHHQKLLTTNEKNINDLKEWYV